MYALFKDGIQISKPHSAKEAALVEAFERKLVVIGYNDFLGEKGPYQHAPTLCNGVEIKEVET